jgi:hypothetical protein
MFAASNFAVVAGPSDDGDRRGNCGDVTHFRRWILAGRIF